MTTALRIIGIGNPMVGDDAVGMHVARRLRDWANSAFHITGKHPHLPLPLQGGGGPLHDARVRQSSRLRQEIPQKRLRPAIESGNSLSDDGLESRNRLASQRLVIPAVEILETQDGGVNLLHLINHAPSVILIDAVKGTGPAGTISTFTMPDDLDAVCRFAWGSSTTSTHAFGLGDVLALAHTLDCLPARLMIYGIEINESRMGNVLSRQVEQAMDQVVDRLRHVIASGQMEVARY